MSFASVYKKLLKEVLEEYEYESAPRGMKIREIENVSLVIDNPYSNLFKNAVRSLPLKYLKKELALYFAARFDADGFAKASKFWNHIKNDDGTINSAYGHLIFNKDKLSQWDWAFKSLISDRDSRQAIMHFNRVEHEFDGVKDFPCTLNALFHIRENRLNMTVEMRSNDVIKGTTFDIPFFMLLQQLMLLRLKENGVEIEMGHYTHIANSMHLYESNFETVENMIKYPFEEDFIPMFDSSNIPLNEDIIDISNGIIKDSSMFEENKAFLSWLQTV